MPTSLRDIVATSRYRQWVQRPKPAVRPGHPAPDDGETTFVLRDDDSFEVAERAGASSEDQR